MAVIPDNIHDITSNRDTSKQIEALFNYIQYMREQIEFWGSNRVKDIEEIKTKISDIESHL